MSRETSRLLYCVAKRDRRRRFSDAVRMGRPKPGADIPIGNQRRVPAIRKRQTEAEDHKMQHNKGRTKRFREGRS
ncbi:hypothetical protein Leryth_022799 [Lithospermum erythrorhizon]|nr:hypothetical protein Leryth_022799 [Lithospermum erythrorhizon]